MSSLLLNKYSPLIEEIKTESGDKSSHIWLLVNPKYPSVNNDIWIPILEVIQDKVYRTLKNRINTRNIYIKNTISDIGLVSNGSLLGSAEIAEDIGSLRESIFEYRPKMIVTFGNLTYELVNRICEIRSEEGPKYWNSSNLEYEFVQSIANFDINKINRIPLPRQITAKSTSMEKYDSYWEERDNYFRDVGTMIADRIIENKDHLNIWID
ncbi:hypothetical protein Desaci_1718 [Desulfosporosinus acidiphilus SJ4]|uniref:Uracil DNA glycosylase superfamily protein n=1 Tax=Desulfosporosinus acidiphilus (strain DSM 22704 / JCM 16185 / SJ4) TaxID=646529 RepID=I4D4I3_DESAJ|nr:hypothetical protein [Desulfosporosinus acidiphilus]AFM40707.1 hypothetical protein Desaci_1718 [Desulfosporosinus acidiphilus SJ4]